MLRIKSDGKDFSKCVLVLWMQHDVSEEQNVGFTSFRRSLIKQIKGSNAQTV